MVNRPGREVWARMPTRQLCIIATTTYVSGVCYASCFPSLAPFLAHLEVQPAQPGATSPMLGLAVALFSIAKVLAAPSVGRWTSHIGVRLSLICCMLLLLLGNALYLCAQSVVWVLVSRVVLGLAAEMVVSIVIGFGCGISIV